MLFGNALECLRAGYADDDLEGGKNQKATTEGSNECVGDGWYGWIHVMMVPLAAQRIGGAGHSFISAVWTVASSALVSLRLVDRRAGERQPAAHRVNCG